MAGSRIAYGSWLLAAAALAGLLTALVDTLVVGNGIAYTLGVYLVLGATAVLLFLSLLLAGLDLARGLRGLLLVLILLGLAGTAVAAYFLTATLLIVFMAIGLIGWLIHLFADPVPRSAST